MNELDDLRPQIEQILKTLAVLSEMDREAYLRALDKIISRLMKHRQQVTGTMPRKESVH